MFNQGEDVPAVEILRACIDQRRLETLLEITNGHYVPATQYLVHHATIEGAQAIQEMYEDVLTYNLRHEELATEKACRAAIAERLIAHGADPIAPNVMFGFGDGTALAMAARTRNFPIVELLVGHGAHQIVSPIVADPGSIGVWAIQAAICEWPKSCSRAKDELILIIRILIAAGTELRENAGNYTLACAIDAGSVEILEILIEAGADVNNTDSIHNSRTVLELAAIKAFNQCMGAVTPIHPRGDFVRMCRMLLNSGADLYVEASNGWNALHAAAHGGAFEAAKEIFSYMEKTSFSKQQTRRFLNHLDTMGRSPLHIAAMRSDPESDKPELVNLMMMKGADPNITDKGSGMTASQLAEKAGRRKSKEFIDEMKSSRASQEQAYRRKSRSRDDIPDMPDGK